MANVLGKNIILINSENIKIGIYLPREGGTVWVYSPEGCPEGRCGSKRSGVEHARGTSRGVSKPILFIVIGTVIFFHYKSTLHQR